MLVLSRKETQRIRLGESIVVTVVRVSGDKVRLGIEAPADILVLRDELEPLADNAAAPSMEMTEITAEIELPAIAAIAS